MKPFVKLHSGKKTYANCNKQLGAEPGVSK